MKKVLGKGKYLRLVREGRWEYVERVNTTGIVAIVGVTRGKELLLVEQERPAVKARVVELPAGLAGDLGAETLETAAQRELEEETGFTARRFERLGDFTSSAGLCTEIVTFFRARGLKRVGEGGGDASEDIDVHLVPLDRVAAWLKRKARDAIIDEKVYSGLWFAGR